MQGYLIPALDRPNLKVLTAAYVRRVVNEKRGEGVVATAVEFDHDGQTYKVKVAKEAIISARCATSGRYVREGEGLTPVAARSSLRIFWK